MIKNKILIIDDEPGFLEMGLTYFTSQGYDVRVASSLEDAVKNFRRHRPQVVLLDFNMPILTGERLLPILQTIDPNVRVIVITGCVSMEVEEKFKGLGYFALFEKAGLSLEKVKQKIDEALQF